MSLFKFVGDLMADQEPDWSEIGCEGLGQRITPAPPVVPRSAVQQRYRFFVTDPYFGALASVH